MKKMLAALCILHANAACAEDDKMTLMVKTATATPMTWSDPETTTVHVHLHFTVEPNTCDGRYSIILDYAIEPDNPKIFPEALRVQFSNVALIAENPRFESELWERLGLFKIPLSAAGTRVLHLEGGENFEVRNERLNIWIAGENTHTAVDMPVCVRKESD